MGLSHGTELRAPALAHLLPTHLPGRLQTQEVLLVMETRLPSPGSTRHAQVVLAVLQHVACKEVAIPGSEELGWGEELLLQSVPQNPMPICISVRHDNPTSVVMPAAGAAGQPRGQSQATPPAPSGTPAPRFSAILTCPQGDYG